MICVRVGGGCPRERECVYAGVSARVCGGGGGVRARCMRAGVRMRYAMCVLRIYVSVRVSMCAYRND